MGNAKYKIQNAKFRGAKAPIIIANGKLQMANFGTALAIINKVAVVRSLIYNQRAAFRDFAF